MSDLPQFLIAGFALAGSPGPNTLSMAGVAAAYGRRRSLGYLAGLTLGMAGVIALVGTGVAALVLAQPGAVPAITALAAAYFLWLAWRIATAPALGQPHAGATAPRWYEGAGLSLMNPKAYAAMAALFSGFTLAEAPGTDAASKTAAALAVILAVNLGWMLAGAALTSALRNQKAARALNLVFAASLLISVAAATVL